MLYLLYSHIINTFLHKYHKKNNEISIQLKIVKQYCISRLGYVNIIFYNKHILTIKFNLKPYVENRDFFFTRVLKP